MKTIFLLAILAALSMNAQQPATFSRVATIHLRLAFFGARDFDPLADDNEPKGAAIKQELAMARSLSESPRTRSIAEKIEVMLALKSNCRYEASPDAYGACMKRANVDYVAISKALDLKSAPG